MFWADDIRAMMPATCSSAYTEFYGIKTIKQEWSAIGKCGSGSYARELGLTPTLEGGLDFKKNLTEAIDGYAGIEHSLPIAPLYNDVVTLLAQSGVTYTPTLLVQYGGPWAENYWYQHHDVLNDRKLARWVPKQEISSGLRRKGVAREQTRFKHAR